MKKEVKKETFKEMQARILAYKWTKVKAIESVGHPNYVISQHCVKPTINRGEDNRDLNNRDRVWPGVKGSFQVVKGAEYEVREDFLKKSTWFEKSKSKNK